MLPEPYGPLSERTRATKASPLFIITVYSSKLQRCNVSIQYPVSSIQYPVFSIQYQCPISNVQYPISNIQYPTSNIQCPTSNVQYPPGFLYSCLLAFLYSTHHHYMKL